MNHKRRVLQISLGTILFIAVMVLLLVSVAHQLFDNRYSNSPTENIREHTQAVLQAAIFPLQTTSSFTMPAELRVCGNQLPNILKRNNNEYSIVIVGVWGDGASPIPGGTGSITATVYVVFPDGTRVEMQYYAYNLELCRLIQSESEPF